MTYKLNPDVRKIVSPVVLMIGSERREYPDGTALSEVSFEKSYMISSLSADGGSIVLTVEENPQINDTSWAKGKPVSFFD